MILLIFSEENEVLDLHEESILNYFNKLKSTCQKNSNRLTVAEVNTNLYKKKLVLLPEWQTIDSTFHTAQFFLNGFTTYRCDRNINDSGILLHDRDAIPSNVLSIVESVEGLYGEIKIRKKKWRID